MKAPKSPMSNRDSLRLKSVISNPRLLVALVFALMLVVSWRRWTSPIADSGREMDLPLRLLSGELLYRDVHHIYPPFAPYFNALLYRLFGAHLETLLMSGATCSGLIVYLCWRMARRVMPATEAALAAIAVTVLCVFKPAGNLISPYSYAALYSTVFALGVVLAMLRFSERERWRELIVAGLLTGLAAVTKQEFALAAAVTIVAALLVAPDRKFTKLIGRVAVVALAGAMVALPVYGWLLWRVGWQTLVADSHLLYTHLPDSLVYYNRQRTGMDQPFSSLLQLTGGLMVSLAIASGLILVSTLSLLRSQRREASVRTGTDLRFLALRSGLALLLATIAVFAVRAFAQGRWDGSPLRALPVALAGLIIVEWRRILRDRLIPVAASDRALFIIAVYSLAVLARVALRVPSGGAFGGFFLPTSLVLIVYLTVRTLPRACEDWTRNQKLAARVRSTGHAMLSLLLAITMIVFAVRYHRTFNFRLTAPRGTLYLPASSGPAISEALSFIEQHTASDEAIVVVPEGSDLAFLSGRQMPLRHQILIPGLMDEAEERAAIAKMQQAGVRYVLIVNRPMREFGAEAFGRDFYQTLGAWITEHYHLVKVCGAPDAASPETLQPGHPQFFIKIFERND